MWLIEKNPTNKVVSCSRGRTSVNIPFLGPLVVDFFFFFFFVVLLFYLRFFSTSCHGACFRVASCPWTVQRVPPGNRFVSPSCLADLAPSFYSRSFHLHRSQPEEPDQRGREKEEREKRRKVGRRDPALESWLEKSRNTPAGTIRRQSVLVELRVCITTALLMSSAINVSFSVARVVHRVSKPVCPP